MELRNNDNTLALPTTTAAAAITAAAVYTNYIYIEVTEVIEVILPRLDSDSDSNSDSISDSDLER